MSSNGLADPVVQAVHSQLANRLACSIVDPSLSPAAVLLLVYPKDGRYCILLNKRAQTLERHKGEIAFPGGARDPEDRDYLDTALRETEEEMGVRRDDVTVLGQLDDVATRSRYGVKVFVGTIPYPYSFQPSPREIADVLEVPITHLYDPANLRYESHWQDGSPVRACSYAWGPHVVHGATAQMVRQFLELMQGVPFEEGP